MLTQALATANHVSTAKAERIRDMTVTNSQGRDANVVHRIHAMEARHVGTDDELPAPLPGTNPEAVSLMGLDPFSGVSLCL